MTSRPRCSPPPTCSCGPASTSSRLTSAPRSGTIDAAAAGVWTHTLERASVRIQVEPFRPYTTTEQHAIALEADRLGAFFGLPACVFYSGNGPRR